MATLRRRTLALAPLLTVALLAGCGDDSKDNLLSSSRAADLEQRLDRVEQTVESGDCETASTEANALVTKIRALPVDSDLRNALAESAAGLQTLVEESCQQETETTPPVETVPPETETVPEEETDTGKGKAKGKDKGKQPKEDGDDEQPPPAEEPPADDGGSGGETDPESGGIEP